MQLKPWLDLISGLWFRFCINLLFVKYNIKILIGLELIPWAQKIWCLGLLLMKKLVKIEFDG